MWCSLGLQLKNIRLQPRPRADLQSQIRPRPDLKKIKSGATLLISMSQAQVHTWPNCSETTSNSYTDIVFIQFFRSLPAVTLTLTFWSQNLTSKSTNPNTSVTKTGWNSLHLFLRYGVHTTFRMHRLMHSHTDGQTRTHNASNIVFQWWSSNKTWFPLYCLK